MKVIHQPLPGLLLIEPKVFGDDRGFFFESFNERNFSELVGRPVKFVQDNHSRSAKHVLRGLHYQTRQPQGKLVRVVSGSVFDVAVDVRVDSPTYGASYGTYLSAENKLQLWLPEGFAHGFLVVSESAEVLYKATDFYAPEYERSIDWKDPALAIDWPVTAEPIVSTKDAKGMPFAITEVN